MRTNYRCATIGLYVTIVLAAIMGCDKDSSDKPKTVNPKYGTTSESPSPAELDRRAQLDRALEYARQRRSSPTPGISLPNYDAGPLNPRPIKRNFYEVDDRYPGYLLTTYDVEESTYSSAKETGWLAEALRQIRVLGPGKFPPTEKVAVIIRNRKEHKDATTFAASHKVGAIYNSVDVFNGSLDLQTVVARSVLDHSPFNYDPSVPQGSQQQWTVIERTQGH